MTKDEELAIQALQGTSGLKVIQSLVEAKLDKVRDVNEINENGMVAEQALARKLTYQVLKEFFGDIKLTTPLTKEERKTYE